MTAAAAMHGYADAFAKAPHQLAQIGADALVEELERALLKATRGDRRLSNLEPRAPQPRVSVTADAAEVTADGAVWAILENGTQAHTIKPRRGKVLRVGDEFRAGSFRVRGVRGKRTYSSAVSRATASVLDAQRVAWEAMHRG